MDIVQKIYKSTWEEKKQPTELAFAFYYFTVLDLLYYILMGSDCSVYFSECEALFITQLLCPALIASVQSDPIDLKCSVFTQE